MSRDDLMDQAFGAVATKSSKQIVEQIALDRIIDSRFQGRILRSDAVAKIAESFAAEGQLTPVLVRRTGARFELVAGHTRVAAARSLGWKTLQALVMQPKIGEEGGVLVADVEAAQALVADNIRTDLSDYEMFRQLQCLEAAGLDVDNDSETARLLNRDRKIVAGFWAFGKLPEDALELLHDNPDLVGANLALQLSRLDAEHQRHIRPVLERVLAKELRQGQVVREIQKLVSPLPERQAPECEIIPGADGKERCRIQLSGKAIKILGNSVFGPEVLDDLKTVLARHIG